MDYRSTKGTNMTPIELKIATKVIADILAAGYSITIAYNDGDSDTIKQSTNATAILTELHQCDVEWLLVYPKNSNRHDYLGWVEFVYGNDGHDLIANYTNSVDWLLDGAEALAQRIADGEPV